MAAIVFALIVIQLCWTVAQSNTTTAHLSAHDSSTQYFQLCRLEITLNVFRFTLYKLLPGSSIFNEEKPVTDLWTSHCEIRSLWLPIEAFRKNPLETYSDTIREVNISHSSINSFPSEYFCHFSTLTSLILSNNRLDDVTKLGLGLNYDCSNCGHRLLMLHLSGNPLGVIKNNSFCHLEQLDRLYLDNCELKFIESGAFLPLKSLRTLEMSGNYIKRFSSGLFRGNPQLWKLIVINNRFDAIYDVQNLTRVITLRFNYNAIASVMKQDLINCTRLNKVHMSHNNISSIEEGAFDSIYGLRELNLNNNRLKSLNKTFLNSNVEKLYLNYNRLTYLALDHLPRNLRKLYVKGNLISRLSYSKESHLQILALTFIDLSNNQFTKLDNLVLPRSVSQIKLSNNDIDYVSFEREYAIELVSGETSLRDVDLRNNRFSVVPMFPHHYNENGKVIPMYNVHGNPLQCSCENTWFLMASRTKEIDVGPPCTPSTKVKASHLFPHNNILTTSQLCESNYNDSNRCQIVHEKIFWLSYSNLNGIPLFTICRFKCPPPCYCYTTFNFNVVHLYCSKTQLKSIPLLLDREKLSSESEIILWLDGNNFNTINSTDFDNFTNVVQLHLNHSHIHTIHPSAFNNLTVLRVLNLNGNNLHTFPVDLFYCLTVLQHLYLSNNRLVDFNVDTFARLSSLQILYLHSNQLFKFAVQDLNITSLRSLTLHNNSWSCDCSFIIKFKEYLKYVKIVRDSSSLVCTTHDEQRKSILHFDQYVCEHDKVVILASTGFVCVLLIISVSLSYCYRRELQLLIYSRVRRRVLTNVNDSEGKLFDVFVAYSNDDFDFMYHNILPGLEGIDNPYIVCVHERDFLAGCVIADNILEAVRISSRTIILLTDNFVRSGWCRFEFKAAHLQMLEDRCPRVLVIVVGHIPANLEPEMMLYLKTNTYLTWGESFFWQKVYNAMPKQRATGIGVARSPNLMPPEIESCL